MSSGGSCSSRGESSRSISSSATYSVTPDEARRRHRAARAAGHGALRSDCTSFVIAHRLSTIRDADLILVMQDGAIVEQGSYAQLLEADGSYVKLYAAQFSGAASDPDAAGTATPALLLR